MARYENSSQEGVLQALRQLFNYSSLRDALGGDPRGAGDAVLLQMLKNTPFERIGRNNAFADQLASAADLALRGAAGPEAQEQFRAVVSSMLVNESVYMNALKSGKVSATANKDTAISITGLTSETAYDVYYVAQDKAGNYSATVGKMTIHTLDTNPPTITQEFTRTNDAAGTSPLADTDVRIVFSESVQDSSTNQKLLALYQNSQDTTLTQAQRDDAADVLTGLLRDDIMSCNTFPSPCPRPPRGLCSINTPAATWTTKSPPVRHTTSAKFLYSPT